MGKYYMQIDFHEDSTRYGESITLNFSEDDEEYWQILSFVSILGEYTGKDFRSGEFRIVEKEM